MKNIYILALFMISTSTLMSQDLDFTQMYALPSFLNPALTGSFNGTYRVGGVYRSQWRSATPYPISTFAFNGEYRIQLKSTNRKMSDYFGLGLKIFSDRVRALEANSNSAALNAAFHKSLNKNKEEVLSGGFEVGIVQKNINYQTLQFADEFDDISEFDLPTAENLEPNNFAFADFSMGINYSNFINKKNAIYIGASLKHLTTPNVSFWRSSESKNPNLITKNKMPLLIGLQFAYTNQIAYRIDIIPRLVVQWQNPHYQINTGAIIRLDLRTSKSNALHAGAFAKITNSYEDTPSLSTLSPFVGFEINDAIFGISYDILVQDVVSNYKNVSVLELSVRYTGETIEDSAICPEF